MDIVVSDTNIFIDLWNIGLLDSFVRLPFSIHTTDLVIAELKTEALKNSVVGLCHNEDIKVKTFKAGEYTDLLSLQRKNLSLTDCSVLYYAQSGGYKVLTGDRRLREVAEHDLGLDVSGILFVIDMMLSHGILSKGEYVDALSALKLTNHRLPFKAIDERIGNSGI